MNETALQVWDDRQLITACLEQRRDAVVEFVRRYRQNVYGLSLRMLGHSQDAEDVTQEVLFRALRNLHRCDLDRDFKPWLTTIAVNCCKTAMRKRRRVPLPTEDLEGNRKGQLDVDASRNELAEELQKALELLKPNQKACFILFYQQELSCEEISTIMDTPIGTIKTWLFRARQEMMTMLSRRQITPEKIL